MLKKRGIVEEKSGRRRDVKKKLRVHQIRLIHLDSYESRTKINKKARAEAKDKQITVEKQLYHHRH